MVEQRWRHLWGEIQQSPILMSRIQQSGLELSDEVPDRGALESLREEVLCAVLVDIGFDEKSEPNVLGHMIEAYLEEMAYFVIDEVPS